MDKFTLTRNAEADLDGIADYTLRRWGEKQCSLYIDGLEACFQRLAAEPGAGRACDQIRPGLMREEQGRHVVFYVPRPYGVRVVRVLHERMLPNRHDLNDDE